MPEILILIRSYRFLMNKIKIKLLLMKISYFDQKVSDLHKLSQFQYRQVFANMGIIL